MRKMAFVQTVIGLALLSACASNTDSKKSFEYGPFTEQLASGQTCMTQQAFKTLKEECEGLQDEALNAGCALPQRQIEFARMCPGQIFTSSNTSQVPRRLPRRQGIGNMQPAKTWPVNDEAPEGGEAGAGDAAQGPQPVDI